MIDDLEQLKTLRELLIKARDLPDMSEQARVLVLEWIARVLEAIARFETILVPRARALDETMQRIMRTVARGQRN